MQVLVVAFEGATKLCATINVAVVPHQMIYALIASLHPQRRGKGVSSPMDWL